MRGVDGERTPQRDHDGDDDRRQENADAGSECPRVRGRYAPQQALDPRRGPDGAHEAQPRTKEDRSADRPENGPND